MLESASQSQDLQQHTSNVQDPGNSEPVLPKVPFSACLAKWAGEEVMADYYSAAAGHKTQAKRYNRIANFPPYLMLQINRYSLLALQWLQPSLPLL